MENQTQTAEGYHLQNGANSDATGTDITYTWENGAWKSENGNAADTEKATNYLLNAYYKIDKDITLSAESFGGLGTKEKPFSGVIVGASQNTTVALTGTNENKDSFGGLIAYSRGRSDRGLFTGNDHHAGRKSSGDQQKSVFWRCSWLLHGRGYNH